MSISRRRFLGVLSAASCVRAKRSLAGPYALERGFRLPAHFAYVLGRQGHTTGLHVFEVQDRGWKHQQFLPSPSPSSLALNPDGTLLFVANRVRHVAGLHTGSVESYKIHPTTGQASLCSRQPLALSAAEPEHLAVSPDGTMLAVACTGGGSYNVLPIAEDGSLLPVRLLRKETGCGPHPLLQQQAHPKQVLFHSQGHLLGVDLGTDRVSAFDLIDGTLAVRARHTISPGSGPNAMCLDHHGTTLFVATALKSQITALRFETGQQALAWRELGTFNEKDHLTCSTLHAHPHADLLMAVWAGPTASTLTVSTLDEKVGQFRLLSKQYLSAPLTHIVALPGTLDSFYAVSSRTHQILSFYCDPLTGHLGHPAAVASVCDPGSVVLRPKVSLKSHLRCNKA